MITRFQKQLEKVDQKRNVASSDLKKHCGLCDEYMDKVILDPNILRQFTLNKYIEAERKNRFIAAKLKKTATAYARNVFLQAITDNVSFSWPTKLKFDWHLPDRRIDPDNWTFTQKFIFDGMQKAQIGKRVFLDNDNVKNIKGFDHDFYVDKVNPRLEIYEMEATHEI